MRAIKNTTVTYSFNDKIYTSNPITEPVEINSENAEQMGSVTGSAVKITAGEGPRKKMCKQYLTNLDKVKITGISLT